MAKKKKDWFCELLTVEDTKVLSEADIQDERESGMSEELIRQEYYCSFEATMPGAYYAEEIMEARKRGRICPVPFNNYLPVHTCWDLGAGRSDDMVIWFFQVDGFMIKFIDLYWNHSKGIGHYKKVLDEKKEQLGYKYGTHLAPHDVERPQHTGGENAETIRQIASMAGIDFVRVPRVADVQIGVEIVRSRFSNFYFDNVKCEHGVSALASYRREWDSKNGIFRLMPVHDWSSHFADSLRTGACGIELVDDTNNAAVSSGNGSYENIRRKMMEGRDREYGGRVDRGGREPYSVLDYR